MKSEAEAASRKRQTRLRREYLYRKSLEGKEKVSYEQKRVIREALASGKSLPTEVRATYDLMKNEVDLEDTKTSVEKSHVDDEYGDAGLHDPVVCVTTSRDPSSRLKQFAKEVKLLFPSSTRINRGNTRVDELVRNCRASELTDIVIVQETRGQPDGLIVSHLPHGPTAYFTISNAVMRHDLPGGKAAPMSEAYPHLILHNFTSPLGQRMANILKCLFPVPKSDSKRVISFANNNDFISFRHHMYTKTTDTANPKVSLHEVGPRFELRLYQLRLGTIDQAEADNEYVLRPYMNTATKNQVLS
uniref:Brix domain-containing protein n=1 Tax=Eucampia antarctica TaxID=49252 RepID=A0A7S2WGL4_9STRA|mmetsp:Transcript_29668/g.28520  ORF Transcript_29668/g.28520 Transcript_29668/m.28520 type:complete len:302 (+) Transcript_29668:183-1088(+)|eukprot:CAMPEP_0197834688 /NCGR_PEP_ID=MMETSP1437-20131217/23322_1 /TAXON_ID=49252 ORGANISM="Eucampia antarctica, Strain CCMP1452" /NCGR_SAMPLE_ID=MMETSP1437 /ASSEMBLY_ACC=CAM_ASM_001096 /LENGTH=301 /DNA_ID=CAMNT_0043439581 /DNA_START=48 /DNA_END=953 /DNA_ORIENTATION=+